MRHCARRFRGSLLFVAAFVIGAGAAVAQELQFDPKALDTNAAASVQTKRGKGRKNVDAAAPQSAGRPAAAQQQGGVPNRQFGELEGWSPGKAPPKPKDKYDAEPQGKGGTSMPVGMSPSGNMAVGLPF